MLRRCRNTTPSTRLTTAAGFITNILLGVKQVNHYTFSDGRTEEDARSTTTGFNKVDISPLVAIGIDHRLTDKIHIVAEPTFRFGLLKTKEAPVEEKLWNLGLNLGVTVAIR